MQREGNFASRGEGYGEPFVTPNDFHEWGPVVKSHYIAQRCAQTEVCCLRPATYFNRNPGILPETSREGWTISLEATLKSLVPWASAVRVESCALPKDYLKKSLMIFTLQSEEGEVLCAIQGGFFQ